MPPAGSAAISRYCGPGAGALDSPLRHRGHRAHAVPSVRAAVGVDVIRAVVTGVSVILVRRDRRESRCPAVEAEQAPADVVALVRAHRDHAAVQRSCARRPPCHHTAAAELPPPSSCLRAAGSPPAVPPELRHARSCARRAPEVAVPPALRSLRPDRQTARSAAAPALPPRAPALPPEALCAGGRSGLMLAAFAAEPLRRHRHSDPRQRHRLAGAAENRQVREHEARRQQPRSESKNEGTHGQASI